MIVINRLCKASSMVHDIQQGFDPSTIVGNISDDIKQAICANVAFSTPESTVFGESIQKRLRITEISVKQKTDEPKKTEAKVVVELGVTEGVIQNCQSNFTDLSKTCSMALILCMEVALHI